MLAIYAEVLHAEGGFIFGFITVLQRGEWLADLVCDVLCTGKHLAYKRLRRIARAKPRHWRSRVRSSGSTTMLDLGELNAQWM